MTKTISQQLSEKTMKELAQADTPKSASRVWKSPQGYKFLVQWSNLVLLRILIRKFTETLPRSEYRAKAQVDDACRSNVANLEEGWKRPSTRQYLEFLGFTQGSLEEVRGDVERFFQDKFLKSMSNSSLSSLGINLKLWNDWCKNPLNSSKILYFPLKENKGNYRNLQEIKASDLSYEIFMELINKTDWLLRRLVVSLERKQDDYKLQLAGLR